MNINSEGKRISEIFLMEVDYIYNIPDYQRNYAWKEDNIDTLISDIQSEDEGYYLGNFIVTKGEGNNSFDVVDGQQRITTIALIYLALYTLFDEILNNPESEGLDDEIIGTLHSNRRDIKRKLLTRTKDPTLILLEPDKTIYEDLLKVFSDPDNVREHRKRILGKRFIYIRESALGKFIEDNSFNAYVKELTEFYDKLNAAGILRISVPDLTDAFTVFTSFNAKGIPLTLIDLLKSFYLKQAFQSIDKETANQKWTELISIFYDKNDEPISSIVTQFVRNNFDTFESKKTSSITQNGALKEYENLFSRYSSDYIDTLINRARIFSNINRKIETINILNLSKETTSLLDKLDKLESTQIYPIIMFLLEKYQNGKVTESILNDTLTFLVSYFVRRNIVVKPKSSNIRAQALASIRELEQLDIIDSDNIKSVQEHLMSISTTEDEFLNALKGPVYDTSKNTLRLMLIDLERAHGRELFSKQYPDNLDDYNASGVYIWTLEHILPQTTTSNEWIEVLKYPNYNSGNEIMNKEIYTHKLGNITLTGYNSELHSSDFIVKRDYRDKDTNKQTGLKTKLFLNESIPSEEETIDTKAKWTLEDIDRRTDYLASKIVELYKLDR